MTFPEIGHRRNEISGIFLDGVFRDSPKRVKTRFLIGWDHLANEQSDDVSKIENQSLELIQCSKNLKND